VVFRELVRGRLIGWDDAEVTLAAEDHTLTLPISPGPTGDPVRVMLRTAREDDEVLLRCGVTAAETVEALAFVACDR